MPMATHSPHADHGHTACTDLVIGAILSGWRYDISGTPASLRGDYENHLHACAHCRRKQRLHRTIDLLLLAVTSLACAAFVLAAIVVHRFDSLQHLVELHLHVPPDRVLALAHIPASISISLEAVAIAGIIVSVLLWALVAMATPVPKMLSTLLRDHVSPEIRNRLWKQAA